MRPAPHFKIVSLLALGVLLVLIVYLRPVTKVAQGASGRATAAAHGPSIYRLNSSWVTDDQRRIELAELSGKFQVVALMFTRCPTVCPTLVHELKRMESRMPARVAARTRFTLVSIDPEHDTPEALREYRRRLQLEAPRWTLLRGDPDSIRELGATLGFGFASEDGAPSAHSKLVTLLSPEGAILHQQAGLESDPDRIIELISSAL